MFGSCYKYNKDKNAVTVYSDNIRAGLLFSLFFVIPLGVFLIPNLTPIVKLAIFMDVPY